MIPMFKVTFYLVNGSVVEKDVLAKEDEEEKELLCATRLVNIFREYKTDETDVYFDYHGLYVRTSDITAIDIQELSDFGCTDRK